MVEQLEWQTYVLFAKHCVGSWYAPYEENMLTFPSFSVEIWVCRCWEPNQTVMQYLIDDDPQVFAVKDVTEINFVGIWQTHLAQRKHNHRRKYDFSR